MPEPPIPHALTKFVEDLRQAQPMPNVFNPWATEDKIFDCGPQAPGMREANLVDYLKLRVGRAKWLLIAEAPSYQGGKFTGIAMTSERMLRNGIRSRLAEGGVYRIAVPHSRTSRPDFGFKSVQAGGCAEPTATVVWGEILKSGLDPCDFVLWNAFAWHPHKPGDVRSNRRPNSSELTIGKPILQAMLNLFPQATTVTIGEIALDSLRCLKLPPNETLRHPSNGGAAKFRMGFSDLVHRSGAGLIRPIQP